MTDLSNVELTTGPLTGHSVRFDGINGRAGSFDAQKNQYMVALDSGFERALFVSPNHLEDLGEYDDPMGRVTGVFEDVPCANSTEENPHTAKRVIRSQFEGPYVCYQCKRDAFLALAAARGDSDE